MDQEAPIDSSLMLSEKFTPAALPEVCAPRRSLIGRFDDAAALRFGYVGAPAGSGKTVSTLLWLKACKRKVVWIGVDRYANAPTVFFKLLATGLLSVQPENVGMRRVLASPSFSASPVEHVIMMLAEMQPPTERYALVLDDVHLVTNREIMKALPAVLKRLPGAFAVFLLSRNELPDELRRVVRDPALLQKPGARPHGRGDALRLRGDGGLGHRRGRGGEDGQDRLRKQPLPVRQLLRVAGVERVGS